MALDRIARIALRVADLREAETFYVDVLGLEVAFREALADGIWRTYRDVIPWDELAPAAPRPRVSMLDGGGVVLALSEAAVAPGEGPLDHVALALDREALARAKRRIAALGCEVLADMPGLLVFADPFGVQWELASEPPADPRELSSGARSGQWLENDPRSWREALGVDYPH